VRWSMRRMLPWCRPCTNPSASSRSKPLRYAPPVVAARSGGLVEFLDEDRHGFGFEPGDPASLAQAVRTALGDRAQASKRVDAAFDYVRTRHGWPAIAERTVAAYESIPRNDARRSADGRQWSPPAIPSHLNLLHELP
jgi:Glycosyltransferase